MLLMSLGDSSRNPVLALGNHRSILELREPLISKQLWFRCDRDTTQSTQSSTSSRTLRGQNRRLVKELRGQFQAGGWFARACARYAARRHLRLSTCSHLSRTRGNYSVKSQSTLPERFRMRDFFLAHAHVTPCIQSSAPLRNCAEMLVESGGWP